jgi:hypothetical protein
MFTQSLNCLKSKYLSFFSAQWVSRYAGTDVSRNLSPPLTAAFLSQFDIQIVLTFFASITLLPSIIQINAIRLSRLARIIGPLPIARQNFSKSHFTLLTTRIRKNGHRIYNFWPAMAIIPTEARVHYFLNALNVASHFPFSSQSSN